VREESHLDEMRSAIRGDFDRLAERRGDQELMRVREEEAEAEPDPAPNRERLELETPVEPEPEPEPEPAEPRKSWLSRLLGS
jgi:hypothetical protein